MKKIIVSLVLVVLALQLSAQNTPVGATQPEYVGVESAQQELREISLSKFEDDGIWLSYMPGDHGFISLRRFEGGPLDKVAVVGEEENNIKEDDKFVLGGKVLHLRRAVTYFQIKPIRPIAIPGITKTLSMWVVGRNVNHKLFVIIRDHFGNRAKIPMTDGISEGLAFTGWRRVYATIPAHIKQTDPRYNNKQGVMISEFLIETDPAETYGSYFFYFDDLRAVVDLFAENNRDSDDMADFW